jgi:hypothetical protein
MGEPLPQLRIIERTQMRVPFPTAGGIALQNSLLFFGAPFGGLGIP